MWIIYRYTLLYLWVSYKLLLFLRGLFIFVFWPTPIHPSRTSYNGVSTLMSPPSFFKQDWWLTYHWNLVNVEWIINMPITTVEHNWFVLTCESVPMIILWNIQVKDQVLSILFSLPRTWWTPNVCWNFPIEENTEYFNIECLEYFNIENMHIKAQELVASSSCHASLHIIL